jgi:hypothetical protein
LHGHFDGFRSREPLINSESFSCAEKIGQIKAPIAGNSKAIDKIGNAELAHFNKQMLIHELIRGSLAIYLKKGDILMIRGLNASAK